MMLVILRAIMTSRLGCWCEHCTLRCCLVSMSWSDFEEPLTLSVNKLISLLAFASYFLILILIDSLHLLFGIIVKFVIGYNHLVWVILDFHLCEHLPQVLSHVLALSLICLQHLLSHSAYLRYRLLLRACCYYRVVTTRWVKYSDIFLWKTQFLLLE